MPVPVVGVIDPGVRAVAKATRNRRVGVVGTVGTIRSGAYQRAIGALPVPLELVPASCPGFVEFVERGETRSDQVAVLAERLLAPVRDAGVDTLLLGCTHYPFLARTIADVMGRDVVLVSSADETAFEVRAILGDDRAAAGRCRPRRGPARVAAGVLVGRRGDGSGPSGAGSSATSWARCSASSWPDPPPVTDAAGQPSARRAAPARRRADGCSPSPSSVATAATSTPAGPPAGTWCGRGRRGRRCGWTPGPGTFGNLQRFTDPLALSAIVLTHEHHDHFSDVEGFITAARWVYEFHRDPVPVYAAPGVRAPSDPGHRWDPRLARGGRR